MKIGVTGTRSGMSNTQRVAVYKFLSDSYATGHELHHGDCIGVDVEVAKIAKDLGYIVVCHPPLDESLRAHFERNDIILDSKTHFARNRCIVDSVDFLIVAPWETSPQKKGGTWYTHDYAVKKKVDLKIFYS